MAFFNTEWAATTSDYIVQNRTPTITSEEYIVGHQIHNVIASLCNFEPTITSEEYIAEHQTHDVITSDNIEPRSYVKITWWNMEPTII